MEAQASRRVYPGAMEAREQVPRLAVVASRYVPLFLNPLFFHTFLSSFPFSPFPLFPPYTFLYPSFPRKSSLTGQKHSTTRMNFPPTLT